MYYALRSREQRDQGRQHLPKTSDQRFACQCPEPDILDDPGHKPATVVNFNAYGSFGYGIHGSYLPLYALHLQLHYSLGITPMIRIETGIGYLLSGSTLKNEYVNIGEFYNIEGSYTSYSFTGNITLPLYLKLTKPTPLAGHSPAPSDPTLLCLCISSTARPM